MPHLIIESSIDIPQKAVEDLHITVGRQESISLSSVKTRIYTPIVSYTGEGQNSDFVCLTLKLLAGRSEQLKNQIATNLLAKAKEHIKNSILTVEVIELGVYKK